MPATVNHVLTSPVADITGTVTVFNASGGTKTEAATNIVRPSDWNSSHAFSFAAVGSEISGAFSNEVGGVTFGLETNGFITAAAPAGGGGITNINVSAGTTSNNLSRLTFDNGNGVSFGLNGSVITGSHNGLTSQSNQALSAANGSFSFQTATFANSNGVSFSTGTQGIFATVATNYAASDHSHGNPSLALTGLNWTTASNSAGLTLSLSAIRPAFSADASSTFQTLSFQDSNGVSFSNNAGAIRLTHGLQFTSATSAITSNAAASNHSHGASGQNGSFAFQTLSFSNANGVSFGTSAGSAITASHNGLTTAALSNHSHGNPTLNLTNLSGTTASNSAGFTLSLSAGNYLTTAAASDHSHGNPTLNLTNLSGTTASNSAGFTLSLSAAAPGGGAAVTVSASNGSFTAGNLNFSNANNVTFGTSAGSIITASVAAPGAAAENNWFALTGNTDGNTTASGSTIALSGGNNITLSGTNGSVIRIDAPASSSLVGVDPISISTNGSTISILQIAETYQYWNPQDAYVQVAGQQGNASMHIQPARAPNVSFDRIAMPVVLTNATNTTGSVTVSFQVGIYTRTASTLSLMSSTSVTQAFTYSGTVNNSTFAGMRLLTIPWSSSLAEGQYYVGIHSRTTSGGANATFSQYLASQVNSVFSGIMGAASNATIQYTRGLGHYSATFSTAVPNSVALSQINGTASIVLRQPVFYLVNGTF